MHKRTKIVVTIGPATEGFEAIQALIHAGMNVARLNFSHGDQKQFKKIVQNIRKAEKKTGRMVTIMQDLQGPKIRIGTLKEPVSVKKGDLIQLSTKPTSTSTIPVSNGDFLPRFIKTGHALLIEDGKIRTEVKSVNGNLITVEVQNEGSIQSHKGINVPDTSLPPSETLTTKDKADLKFGVLTLKVDAVALSFVERAENIQRIRKEVQKLTQRPVALIAKIERKEALNHLEEIIDAVEGVMVARGDLAIETKLEEVPVYQRRIINLARKEGKPVIVATQMLQSMVENPSPTRAEVSDVAHAVFDHTDGVMLSNESAVGQYPIEAVKTLTSIAETTEKAMFQEASLYSIPFQSTHSQPENESMALNACEVAEQVGADKMMILTRKAYTPRMILKHRPKTPVIILTPNLATARYLNFIWGVEKVHIYKGKYRSEEALHYLKMKGEVKSGQSVVYVTLSERKRSLVVMKV